MEQMETGSFISQLHDLKEFVSYSLDDHKVALCLIDNRDSIKSILHNFDIKFSFININQLNDLLKIIF